VHISLYITVLITKSQAQSETIRTAVENLQDAMKGYKSLMTEPTQQRIDTAIKFGSVIAEACLFLPLMLMSYTPTDGSVRKLGFGIAKVTFDVNISPQYFSVISYLHSSGI
jgi:hypothetical protein